MATGKRLAITDRDIALFMALRRYRYLRSTYLHAFAGGASETRFKERLGNLFHEGYLNRPSEQWQFAEARYSPAIYELGAGAERLLRQVGHASPTVATPLARIAHRQFLHSLMICEITASFELALRGGPDKRFVTFPEILARAPEATRNAPMPIKAPLASGGFLIPDALFAIEYRQTPKSSYRFFALEADRETMPVSRSDASQTSFMAKVAAYRELIASGGHTRHWGIPNLLVLTVTLSEQRSDQIISDMVKHGVADARFLFRTAAPRSLNAPAVELFDGAWRRAGHPTLHIDR